MPQVDILLRKSNIGKSKQTTVEDASSQWQKQNHSCSSVAMCQERSQRQVNSQHCHSVTEVSLLLECCKLVQQHERYKMCGKQCKRATCNNCFTLTAATVSTKCGAEQLHKKSYNSLYVSICCQRTTTSSATQRDCHSAATS